MSYFDPILASKDRTFLLILNDKNEVGMALLDDNGKPTTWCFGNPEDVLQDGLRATNPGAVVLVPDKGSLSQSTQYWYEDDEVDKVLSVLNGPPCDERGRLLALFDLGGLVEFVRESDEENEAGESLFVRAEDNATDSPSTCG